MGWRDHKELLVIRDRYTGMVLGSPVPDKSTETVVMDSSFTPGMVLAVSINAKYRFVSSTLTLSDSYQKPYK